MAAVIISSTESVVWVEDRGWKIEDRSYFAANFYPRSSILDPIVTLTLRSYFNIFIYPDFTGV